MGARATHPVHPAVPAQGPLGQTCAPMRPFTGLAVGAQPVAARTSSTSSTSTSNISSMRSPWPFITPPSALINIGARSGVDGNVRSSRGLAARAAGRGGKGGGGAWGAGGIPPVGGCSRQGPPHTPLLDGAQSSKLSPGPLSSPPLTPLQRKLTGTTGARSCTWSSKREPRVGVPQLPSAGGQDHAFLTPGLGLVAPPHPSSCLRSHAWCAGST